VSPARLLLVEDDDAVAGVVCLHLQQAGYAVHREADGRRAMDLFDRQPWDLLLLDLMLPGADGLDVCRHVRGRPGHVPIIMLSARSAEMHRVIGLEMGADDYLPKPFSMVELTARVRALLRRAAGMARVTGEPAPLHFGAFRLEPSRRALFRQQQALPLTLREFDLLHFFVRHPQVVFSRAQLLDRVWGPGFEGYEHTVNSHVNRLRTKIEADPHDPRLICTVWGVGYRFESDVGARP